MKKTHRDKIVVIGAGNVGEAIAYTLMVRVQANDIVLIILWVLASVEDIVYFPMVICFLMFLINDIYGFISWKAREKKQGFV